MADAHEFGESVRPEADSATSQGDNGTLVAWTADSGSGEKSHVVHVGHAGVTWALAIKKTDEFAQLVASATAQPGEAATLIEGHRKGHHVSGEQLAGVTYTKDLNQLTIIDSAGKKQGIAYGKDNEQGRIFEAVGQHLGGTAREEEADAWSIMKGPMFALTMVGLIGGLFIYVAATADPDYVASGRRSGMKQLINWLGYTVGPTWTSVIVGGIALLIFAFMVFLLIKRPKRQVLDF